jgi:hypothetical protein
MLVCQAASGRHHSSNTAAIPLLGYFPAGGQELFDPPNVRVLLCATCRVPQMLLYLCTVSCMMIKAPPAVRSNMCCTVLSCASSPMLYTVLLYGQVVQLRHAATPHQAEEVCRHTASHLEPPLQLPRNGISRVQHLGNLHFQDNRQADTS